MKPLLAVLTLGLAITAGLICIAIQWGDCSLAEVDG